MTYYTGNVHHLFRFFSSPIYDGTMYIPADFIISFKKNFSKMVFVRCCVYEYFSFVVCIITCCYLFCVCLYEMFSATKQLSYIIYVSYTLSSQFSNDNVVIFKQWEVVTFRFARFTTNTFKKFSFFFFILIII